MTGTWRRRLLRFALGATRETGAEALDDAGGWIGNLVADEADETSN